MSDTITATYELEIRAASEALSEDPKNVKALYRRGVARKHMYLLKVAMSDFKNVLRIDPHCHEARAEFAVAMELWEEGEGDETDFNTSEDEAPHPEADPDNDNEHHMGRGAKMLVPCRFYNHDGCNKGAACACLFARAR
ncbi:hypothetical protein FIBSPDRAFT_958007 [Athelia psychrophila]|uniref:Uncharacterized protein n=1 Tax=Athelia psychrophila TaxID=1759441 RepID=A0A166F4Z6_9AGAM|nr:hypothetical protein FIBSPDRAFT_958007 [Fibularhizoctonia sp. CBS 109695]